MTAVACTPTSFVRIVLAIPLLIIDLPVLIDVGSPVLFKQKRIAFNNKEFSLLKFCSMNNKCDENGVCLPDGERITKLGNFLRRSSSDEFPSLLSIKKGMKIENQTVPEKLAENFWEQFYKNR